MVKYLSEGGELSHKAFEVIEANDNHKRCGFCF